MMTARKMAEQLVLGGENQPGVALAEDLLVDVERLDEHGELDVLSVRF